MIKRSLIIYFFLFISANAEEIFDYDLVAKQIAKDTYVFVGAKEDFSYKNGGNIVNTGFIVTEEGVVIIDTGPSYTYGSQMKQAIIEITNKPIIKILITHHHPDHFLGNQAFTGVPIFALPKTIQQLKREANGFLDNMYRLVGKAMKDTEVETTNIKPLSITQEKLGRHHLEYIYLSGHTPSDLVIFDKETGVLFTGDLTFHNRALTTPHAQPEEWLNSLDVIKKVDFKIIVPGHGEITENLEPVEQTRDYLVWLEKTISNAVEHGLEMNEVLALPIPDRFKEFSVLNREFTRSVTHRYPVYEKNIFDELPY